MGQLYEYCEKVNQHIEDRGLDLFKTRGAIAIKAGFLITLVSPDDPDDPEKIESLKRAAELVIGLRL